MNALDLLLNLEARGVCLKPRGEKLIVDAPVGALTPKDWDLLRQLRADLFAILQTSMMPADLPAEWHALWDERAAIMEYGGGLHREHAEVLAMKDILQQMLRAGQLPRDGA
jgi:hypothetical protein